MTIVLQIGPLSHNLSQICPLGIAEFFVLTVTRIRKFYGYYSAKRGRPTPAAPGRARGRVLYTRHHTRYMGTCSEIPDWKFVFFENSGESWPWQFAYVCIKDGVQDDVNEHPLRYSASLIETVQLQGKFRARIFPSAIFSWNCGLCVHFGTTTPYDSERSRVHFNRPRSKWG